MKLKVDLGKLEKKKEKTDPRVAVRFGFLVRTKTNVDIQEVDDNLRKVALSSDLGASLSDIIHRMVSVYAYRKARLSLPEFLARFKEHKLADLIADSLVNKLSVIDEDEWLPNGPITVQSPVTLLEADSLSRLESAYTEVLEDTLKYLERVSFTSAATVHEFLVQKKIERPMVKIHDLFVMDYQEIREDGEVVKTSLRDKIVEKIYAGVDKVAASAYKEMFREDRRGFVMGFMMGVVIKYSVEEKRMVFDAMEFRNLMHYLSDIGADINNINGKSLYTLLYEDSQSMIQYVSEQQKIGALRVGVREDISSTGLLDVVSPSAYEEQVIFEEGFDVKAFHDKYIKPELFKFYSKKQKGVSPVREGDVMNGIHNSDTHGRDKYTLYLLKYAKIYVETYRKDPAVFMLKVRDLFGLSVAHNAPELSDEQVNQHFTYYFEQAEKKFTDTVKEALYFRGDVKIGEEFVYPEEILKCRSFPQLLEWFVSPDLFRKAFPVYGNLPKDQISFMCSVFLKDFMRTMDEMSKQHVIETSKLRDLVEKDLSKMLNIERIADVDLRFRILKEVDHNGNLVEHSDYDVVVDPDSIDEFLVEQDNTFADYLLKSPTLAEVQKEGKTYRVSPEERRKFKLVQMTIPIVPLDPSGRFFVDRQNVVVRALIYSGGNHNIHVKNSLARVTAMDRGKTITDDTRWRICFPDAYALRAFKEFMYSRNPGKFIKVEDLEENRQFSNKKGGRVKVNSTKRFKKFQDYKVTGEINRTQLLQDGLLQNKAILLETQASMFLPKLLIGDLSEYTESSHPRYRSQRVWSLLFSLYFPPDIFGDQFKRYEQQGYDFES